MTRAYRFLGPMVRVVVGTAANEFQRKTGIRVGLTLEGIAGETLAQGTAEAATVSPTVRRTWPFDAPLAPGATVALTVEGHGITLIRP